MKQFKKINREKVFFVLIIFISIIIISFKFFIKDIQPFGLTILQVSSNSMIPTFRKGDFIIIKKQTEYAVGDIITYEITEENEKYYVTHRIIEKNENEYITKGDANNREDGKTVKNEEIKGKVLFFK